MATISNYAEYFNGNTQLAPDALADRLRSDMAEKIERIYESVQTSQLCQQQVLLQNASNSLRRSVEHISLDAKQPVFKNDGQCLGACEWLIALFLNIKKKHPDVATQKLLVEIAKEFKEGVGIQGACLQKSSEEDVDHQKIVRALNFELQEKSEWDLRNKEVSTEILKNILQLEEGVYLLSFSGYKSSPGGHATVEDDIPGHGTVIVIEKGNYYIFDPNVGVAGTGREIGTEDKIRDISFLLAMCRQYSPFERAEELFQKGLKELSQVIGEKEAKIIQKIIPAFKEGRACLGAFAVHGIYEGFKQRGRIFSEKEESAIFFALCYNPGWLQIRLEMSEALRLRKCVFVS